MNKSGISLIILTITIAVMAILASATLATIDSNDIVNTSKETVKKQNKETVLEELEALKNTVITDNFGKITVDGYINYLKSKGKAKANVTTNKDGSKSFETYNGYVASATEDGENNIIIDVEGMVSDAKPKIEQVKLTSDNSSININVELKRGVYVEYTYSYKIDAATEYTVINSVPTKQRYQKIKGLLPGTGYDIKVTATNAAGEVTEVYNIRTK